jgi:hypothetical protein
MVFFYKISSSLCKQKGTGAGAAIRNSAPAPGGNFISAPRLSVPAPQHSCQKSAYTSRRLMYEEEVNNTLLPASNAEKDEEEH